MENTKIYDFTVIGAGYGGLSAAALLAKEKLNVLLLEAHSVVGGCASFYSRKGFLFDAGATTMSGVRKDQPLGKLFTQLGIEPNLKKLDPGMIINIDGKELKRFADLNKWKEETSAFFDSGDKLNKFWDRVHQINDLSFELISNNYAIPPKSLGDFFKLIKFSNLKGLKLLPYLFEPVSDVVKKYGLDRIKNFESFLDEQLLITTQQNIKKAPFLTAALGLAYPAETYYPYGGIYFPAKEIQRSFKEKGGEIKLKSKVTSVKLKNGVYEVENLKGEKYRSKGVIFNIPVWNISDLVSGEIKEFYTKISPKTDGMWGAFTLNFAVPNNLENDLPSAYYQIHTGETVPNCSSKSFFCTLSLIDDLKRAPAGYKTVSISLHTKAEDWLNLSKEEYSLKKLETVKYILNKFDKVFLQFYGSEKLHLEAGTPRTFLDYTSRFNGYVGGIPHSVDLNLLKMPPNVTPFKNVYNCGDTFFPGQGTLSVSLAAQNIVHRIINA